MAKQQKKQKSGASGCDVPKLVLRSEQLGEKIANVMEHWHSMEPSDPRYWIVLNSKLHELSEDAFALELLATEVGADYDATRSDS